MCIQRTKQSSLSTHKAKFPALVAAPQGHELAEDENTFAYAFHAVNSANGDIDNFGSDVWREFSRTYLLEKPVRAAYPLCPCPRAAAAPPLSSPPSRARHHRLRRAHAGRRAHVASLLARVRRDGPQGAAHLRGKGGHL